MGLNPVERRLVDLCDRWERFRADAAKRLLVWQVPDNAARLLQCFFEVQKHETTYATGDLFIVFGAPFDHSIQYSRSLKEALAGQYDASRDDLEREGVAPDWRFVPDEFPDSASGFVRSLRSFGSRHHQIIGHLVAVLTPSRITDEGAFVGWLARALGAGIPERLRLVVIDSLETPRLQRLIGPGQPLVCVDAPPVDALTTAQETFAQEGGIGPAAVFRNFLIGLVTLIEKGSADQAKVKAADALAFARKARWADQEVVIAMLMGGALLKEKRFGEAVDTYRSARQSACQAAAEGHPAGRQLVLQTFFGEAAAHLAAGDAARAAECYDQAAVVAQQIPNLILAIEALRMGAFCHARIDRRDAAIERGSDALLIGERLKPEARPMTTLPLAAIDLLRVVEPERVKLMEHIKQRLAARTDQSRETVERRALELEQVNDARRFRAVEESFAQDAARAEQDAARQIDRVATAGGTQFRQIFARARALLGEQWPLANLAAVPGAARSGQAANAAGAAAS